MGKLTIKMSKWISLFIGLILIITGVSFLFNPLEATVSIINWIGFALIITGFLKIVRYFSHNLFRSGVFLITSILDIILGVFILGNNITSLKILVTVLGFWQLFSGISGIAASIDLQRAKVQRWWLGIIYGVISIVFGYILIKDMQLASIYISFLVGLNMILYGSVYISTFLAIDQIPKNILKRMEREDEDIVEDEKAVTHSIEDTLKEEYGESEADRHREKRMDNEEIISESEKIDDSDNGDVFIEDTDTIYNNDGHDKKIK